MDNFKRASQLQLRFTTDKGSLSVEQLWSLNQTQLANLAKSVKKTLKDVDDDDLGFLTTETKTVNVENQLRFDIVKDIYLTKKAEADAVKQAKDKKEFEQKILGLIQEKKEEGLKGKTIEELQAMLGD